MFYSFSLLYIFFSGSRSSGTRAQQQQHSSSDKENLLLLLQQQQQKEGTNNWLFCGCEKVVTNLRERETLLVVPNPRSSLSVHPTLFQVRFECRATTTTTNRSETFDKKIIKRLTASEQAASFTPLRHHHHHFDTSLKIVSLRVHYSLKKWIETERDRERESVASSSKCVWRRKKMWSLLSSVLSGARASPSRR